jgi:hypothetical protein
MEAHRCSIGYEIEPRYFEIGRARFGQTEIEADVEFVMRDKTVREPGSSYSRTRVLSARR